MLKDFILTLTDRKLTDELNRTKYMSRLYKKQVVIRRQKETRREKGQKDRLKDRTKFALCFSILICLLSFLLILFRFIFDATPSNTKSLLLD